MSSSGDKETSSRSSFGIIATGIIGSAAFGLTALSVPFVLPALRRVCLPYVPATEQQVRNVMSILYKKKGSVIDLGSGDGRLVIESAKLGFPSSGVELNPWLVLLSRFRAISCGVNSLTTFKCQDLWKINLKEYDNVVIFGVQEMMQDLEQKFSKELRCGSSIIACRFPLPNWKPTFVITAGIDSVWLYEKSYF